MLSAIEEANLINTLFESIRYNPKEQTQSFFEHIELLIDQIYGVEDDIIRKAQKRFISLPDKLQKQALHKKPQQKLTQKLYDFQQMVPEDVKQKRIQSKLFREQNTDRAKNQSLDSVKRNYSFYINKILNYKVDPYITMKREAWTDLVDLGKLSKFANVFDRLKADNKMQLLQKIKEDPRQASKIANGRISFHPYLADTE